MSSTVMSIGAAAFGFTIGYLTYRTLIRAGTAKVSDLTVIVGALGGAAVTSLFNPAHGDLFGWYAIGLTVGLFSYLALFWKTHDKKETAKVLGAADIIAGQTGNVPPAHDQVPSARDEGRPRP
jgi:hypothetical protein